MTLEIRGNVNFFMRNLKKGNEVTSKMQSGELVINGAATPFVLRKVAYGRAVVMQSERPTTLRVSRFEQNRSTVFTKRGYVNLLLNGNYWQAWVYIKKEFLEKFFSAICMGSV